MKLDRELHKRDKKGEDSENGNGNWREIHAQSGVSKGKIQTSKKHFIKQKNASKKSGNALKGRKEKVIHKKHKQEGKIYNKKTFKMTNPS